MAGWVPMEGSWGGMHPWETGLAPVCALQSAPGSFLSVTDGEQGQEGLVRQLSLGLSLSSALCVRCSGRCRAKPRRTEDEPARRRSMRLLREPPLDVPLLDRLPQPEAEPWVRWGGAAGGLGALQLSEATAGDTAGWCWASH